MVKQQWCGIERGHEEASGFLPGEGLRTHLKLYACCLANRSKISPKSTPCQSGLHRPCPVSLSVGTIDAISLGGIDGRKIVQNIPLQFLRRRSRETPKSFWILEYTDLPLSSLHSCRLRHPQESLAFLKVLQRRIDPNLKSGIS